MLEKGDKIGDYALVKFLGRGQFGVVWLAEKQIQFSQRRVRHALKFLSSFGDEVTQKSVQAEIDTWIEASGHQNVMSVLDMIEFKDHVVIASEYADGGSLLTWLKESGGKAPSERAALEMMTGILCGIEHLHSRNVVHRDLKPDNILLQGNCPRITDFGVSRIISTGSMSAIAMGSPFYMSPESFEGSKSTQTDIWAAGVILYEMLSGGHPYTAESMIALVSAIRDGDPKPLPETIAPELRAVVDKALKKNLSERYQTAKEMRSALERELYQSKSMTPAAAAAFDPTHPTVANVQDQILTAYISKPVMEHTEMILPGAVSNEDVPGKDTSVNEGRVSSEAVPAFTQSGPPIVGASTMSDSQRQQVSKKPLVWILGAGGAAAAVVIIGGIIGLAFVTRAVVSRYRGAGDSIAATNAASPAKVSKLATPVAPEEMVYVNGGDFGMGRDNGESVERPAHPAKVSPFFIDTYEVTNKKYAKFLAETGHSPPKDWPRGVFRPGHDEYPVVGVNWNDANAYATWAGKRLPTEEEWEFAARGPEGFMYPWGNKWIPGNANVGTGRFANVGSHPGKSPFGAYDMIGNAWEWTSSDFRPYDKPAANSDNQKVIRGGSYEANTKSRIATFRLSWNVDRADTYNQTGFRCAKDSEK